VHVAIFREILAGVNDSTPTIHATARNAPSHGVMVGRFQQRCADSVRCVDVRIGVTQAPREISIELADDADRDDLKQRIEAALAGASDVLAITDKRGNETFVPSAKIAYAELGSQEGARSIGFGG